MFRLLKKARPMQWNEEANKAFLEMKKYLSRPPVLVAPEPQETLLLYISATPAVVSAAIVVEREETIQQGSRFPKNDHSSTTTLPGSLLLPDTQTLHIQGSGPSGSGENDIHIDPLLSGSQLSSKSLPSGGQEESPPGQQCWSTPTKPDCSYNRIKRKVKIRGVIHPGRER